MKRLIKILFWPLSFVLGHLVRLGRTLALYLGGDAAKRRRKAQRYANSMQAEFSRLGFTKKIKMKKKTRRERVRFDYPLLLTHDELWCPIDLPRLPTGVKTDDLTDESVIRSIEDRLDTAVRIDRLATGKLCFVVRMSGTKFPEKVSINAFQLDPEAPALAVPFGVDADGNHVAVDLLDLKHLLIAGATGGGKTTFYHALITTLIQRNSADDLELWMIDLKRSEMALYKPLMGRRGQGGIVGRLATDAEQAVEVLDAAFREINRRNQHMENLGAANINDLAQSTGQRLKRIVLLCDEFAMLTLDTTRMGKQTIGSIATNLMARIAALGRSAGVTICIATQMVNKDVLSGLIRANFENRLCFSCADWRQSQLVVESSEADGLPPGRAILRREGRTTELQTCLITARQVRIEVDRISEFGPDGAWGEDLELARFVRESKLLITAACQHFAGDMSRNKILALEGVRGVISHERFNELAQRLERDGVLVPGRSNKPRRVAPGFFNRPALLDALYSLPAAVCEVPTEGQTAPPTAEEPTSLLSEPENLLFGSPEAVNGDCPNSDVVVCCLGDQPDHVPDPDMEEDKAIESYEAVKRMIEEAAKTEEAKKPRKKRSG